MNKKILIHTSVWLSIWDLDDVNHNKSYWFYQYWKDKAIICFSPLTFFEYQAWKSSIYRKKNLKENPLREWYIIDENTLIFDINNSLVEKSFELELFNKFNKLKWADLIHACIAKTNNLILATNDYDFKSIESDLEIIFVKNYEITDEMFSKIYT